MKKLYLLVFLAMMLNTLNILNAEELSKDEQKQLQNYKNLTKWIIDNKTNFDPLIADTKKKSQTKWVVEPNQNDKITQAGYVEHKVIKGETIYSIAKKYGVLEVDVLKWNNLASVNELKINNVLKIFIGAKTSSKNANDNMKDNNIKAQNINPEKKEDLLIVQNNDINTNLDNSKQDITKQKSDKQSDKNLDEASKGLDLPVVGASEDLVQNKKQDKALNKDQAINPVLPVVPLPNNSMNLNMKPANQIEEKKQNVPTQENIKTADTFDVKNNDEEEFPQFKYYKVKKGDTISSISKAHSMTNNELILMNNIKPPYELTLDTLLKVKSNYKEQAGHSNSGTSVFEWPVVGRLLIGFGPQSGGVTNEGINISAKKGTFVKATQNGVVIYIGNDLDSFGNIVLLQHNNGWVSAYAHVENIRVKKGEHVAQSQIIADVGTSGGVSQPQLHFELRQNVKPMDPLLYLNSHR